MAGMPKIYSDTHFEWIFERIIEGDWGSQKIIKEYLKRYRHRPSVSQRSIDRFIKQYKKEIERTGNAINREEILSALGCGLSGNTRQPANTNNKQISPATGEILPASQGKFVAGGDISGEQVKESCEVLGIPPSFHGAFREAAERKGVKILSGLGKVINIGEFLIRNGLADMRANDFVRAIEAYHKMTGGAVLELEQLGKYQKSIDILTRALLETADDLTPDRRQWVLEQVEKAVDAAGEEEGGE